MISRIVRRDERLRSIELPGLGALSDPPRSGDLIVLCAGFEERATALIDECMLRGVQGLQIIVIGYEPEHDDNRMVDVIARCQKVSENITRVTYDRAAPERFEDEISRIGGMVHQRLIIDVSAMSRLLIAQMLVQLTTPLPAYPIDVVYTEAREYFPRQEDCEEHSELVSSASVFLSTGVVEVFAPPALGTSAMVGSPVILVAFPSFNPYQLAALVSESTPSKVALLHGVPPRKDLEWREEAIRERNRHLAKVASPYRTSTRDYRETVRTLAEIYSQHRSSHKIIIAPTGSKMQTVGVALVRNRLPDIQVVYPAPLRFAAANQYSGGHGEIFSLRFSEVVASIS